MVTGSMSAGSVASGSPSTAYGAAPSTGPAPDDLFWVRESEPITESDDRLREIVAGADLPILLAALAAATGDLSVLTPHRRPPLPPAVTGPVPQGGMGEELQAEIREVAFGLLRRLREERITTAPILGEAESVETLRYLANTDDPDVLGLLAHESALSPAGRGTPEWTCEEIAPGRAFDVLVVGSGVAGIAAAYRLKQAGVSFTVIEAGANHGGTWWKNTYPGVRLDSPTFGYSYSFAQYGAWSLTYAVGGQIHDYLSEVVARAGLAESITFNTALTAARYDEAAGTWTVTLRHTDSAGAVSERTATYHAILTATGQLDAPRIPEFPGQEEFRGVQVHSQQWHPGVDYRGKRVAVIGSGASAYQIVPAVVDDVSDLVLFQRSAPWILPAPNYHAAIPDSLSWLLRKVPHYAQWYRLWVTLNGARGRFTTVKRDPAWNGKPHTISETNQKVRDFIVAYLEKAYADRPDLLELAIPTYIPGSKRMLRDNGVWARALQQPHTTVVSAPIARLDATGIVDSDGIHHDVDVVIYATGFRASDYLDGIEVRGIDGQELHEYWDGDARAWAGVTVPGFPNLFMLMGPNTSHVVGGNINFTAERCAEYSIKLIKEILEHGAKAIDLRQQALDDFIAWVEEENRELAWSQPGSTAWYVNRKGRASQVWPYYDQEFWRITERVELGDYRLLH